MFIDKNLPKTVFEYARKNGKETLRIHLSNDNAMVIIEYLKSMIRLNSGNEAFAMDLEVNKIGDNNPEKIDPLVIAFLQGAKYWEYEKEKATMWQSDQTKVLQEGTERLKNGQLGKYIE